jgi:hypothetical protein
MARIGKGQEIPFSITCAGATKVIIVFGVGQTVLQAFYYGITPATAKLAISNDFTVDWTKVSMTLLTLAGSIFSGKLTEAATYEAKSDMLVMDFKAWSSTQSVTKHYPIKILGDSFVKRVSNA